MAKTKTKTTGPKRVTIDGPDGPETVELTTEIRRAIVRGDLKLAGAEPAGDSEE